MLPHVSESKKFLQKLDIDVDGNIKDPNLPQPDKKKNKRKPHEELQQISATRSAVHQSAVSAENRLTILKPAAALPPARTAQLVNSSDVEQEEIDCSCPECPFQNYSESHAILLLLLL